MASSNHDHFDFIVVGGGPAGCVVANRLANCGSKPSVLLLEAGGANDKIEDRILADKYKHMMDTNLSSQRLTVPQTECNGKTIDLRRGRGLGGCTANNLCGYTIGPIDDYEEWARVVGDDGFNWENAKRRYKEIENYKVRAPKGLYDKYVRPKPEEHGHNGLLDVEFAPKWESSLVNTLDYLEAAGLEINLDINSGNELGVGVIPSTAHNGYRHTGASAFLKNAPPNLTCITESPVTQVLFDGKKAVSVRTASNIYYGSKDIILSCGALDSPKLLKLSGIGPHDELSHLGINVVHDLAGVGENLRDHPACRTVLVLKDENDGVGLLYSQPSELDAAKKQFLENGDGPLAIFSQNLIMGWSRLPEVYESKEFKNLPEDVQSYVLKPTIPTAEFIGHIPPSMLGADPNYQYLMLNAIGQIPQSQGTVKLASADPQADPLVDVAFLSHPFDRRTMISSLRNIMAVLESPAIKSRTLVQATIPKSSSDDDILEYLREHTVSTFHPACTVKMGKSDDLLACLDTRFRVRGVQNLRVVDLSSLPLLPNCHPQSFAYLVGWIAAERIAADNNLVIA